MLQTVNSRAEGEGGYLSSLGDSVFLFTSTTYITFKTISRREHVNAHLVVLGGALVNWQAEVWPHRLCPNCPTTETVPHLQEKEHAGLKSGKTGWGRGQRTEAREKDGRRRAWQGP